MGTLIDMMSKVFAKENSASKNLAKERLQLVIMHDRASLSPDLIMKLKEELIKVLTKYVEIDEDGLEVNLDRGDDSVALVANVPVKKVRRV